MKKSFTCTEERTCGILIRAQQIYFSFPFQRVSRIQNEISLIRIWSFCGWNANNGIRNERFASFASKEAGTFADDWVRWMCIRDGRNSKMTVARKRGESCISIAYRICFEIRDEANSGSRCDSRCATRDYARIPKGERRPLRMHVLRSETRKIKNLEMPPARLHANRASV